MANRVVSALAWTTLAAGVGSACNLPKPPASAEYSTRLVVKSSRSGVNDFAAKWAPVEGAIGYRLCWDIIGADKFTNDYVKSSTCVTLDGPDTVYNNGEQTGAAPRYSNSFKNVRVAAIDSCGTGGFIMAESKVDPVVPYVCPDNGEFDPNGFASAVTLTAADVSGGERTAAGAVAWTYATPDAMAREMVCVVQIRGELGITQQRECFMTSPGAESTPYSLHLREDTVLVSAEVRRLNSCIGGYDSSNTVAMPQLYVPFGTNIVNSLEVCLVTKAGSTKLVYGNCNSAKAVKTVAGISAYGTLTGVFANSEGQCVVVNGGTVSLGGCVEGAGWMTWKRNSYLDYEHQYVREFASNMCMPFGKGNAKFGQAPVLVDCATLP